MELTTLSSSELLAHLDVVWTAGNRALAKMLAYLGEVERRGLHVEMACSSMFVFLERRFGLTGSAYRRLTAARLVRRFPSLLSRVEEGDLHLEGLCLLKDVLTEANVETLTEAASRKTLREIEHLVACLAPKPDVEASIRKLPERRPSSTASAAASAAAATATAPPPTTPTTSRPSAADRTIDLFAPPAERTVPDEPAPAPAAPTRAPAPAPAVARVGARARVEQLSEARHKVQLTVSAETRAKIDRASALMKHRNPSGELEVLFDRAMDALIEKLEKERLAKTSRPQKSTRPSEPGHVPAAVRREVFERDGESCTYLDAQGNRCGCTELLELDHVVPRAHGGTDDASNLRVACRAHNRWYAEQIFGKEYVAARIETERRASD
ncbi:MAG: HNH endonuclease [Deltaproteobacteria bacterium]|nr:HNH endonuclease [Deltaproteobacteria bacterium]